MKTQDSIKIPPFRKREVPSGSLGRENASGQATWRSYRAEDIRERVRAGYQHVAPLELKKVWMSFHAAINMSLLRS